MQEKEFIMTVQCELKIPSLEITVRHHEANSYPRDGIFNPHLLTIKYSYILSGGLCRIGNENSFLIPLWYFD